MSKWGYSAGVISLKDIYKNMIYIWTACDQTHRTSYAKFKCP